MKNKYKSCADCMEYKDVMDCKKFNTFIGKVFSVIFRSNREGSIKYFKEKGYDNFAAKMDKSRRMSIGK